MNGSTRSACSPPAARQTHEGRRAHGNTFSVWRGKSRSNTDVVGISYTIWRGKPVFSVCPTRKKFNIRRLGVKEAFRQAVAHRAAHEAAVLAQNEAMGRVYHRDRTWTDRKARRARAQKGGN